MAYKVFSNGDALTGGELNTYLMNQSVMVFATTSARDAALTTPNEGMIVWLEDSNKYVYYTGSAWTDLIIPSSSGNIIINGAFEINQRNYVSATNLASGAYGFDRWKSTFTNTSLTFTSAPQGQEVTISSGGSIEQIIERQNIPAGTYTLSWTGTATGRVYNTGATPPSYAASPITITLDGLANVEVEFTATGSTKTLSKVMFESGSTANAFTRNATTLQGELAACQRYYWRTTAGGSSDSLINSGLGFSTTIAMFMVTFPSSMRTPTSLDVGNFGVYRANNSTAYSGGTWALNQGFDKSARILYTHGSAVFALGDQIIGSTTSSSGFFGVSAEL
jgi:hypothetical protein